MKTRRWLAGGICLATVCAGLLWCVGPYVAGAAFVIDVSGQDVFWRTWLPVSVRPVVTEDVWIPTRHGAIAGRLFLPADGVAASTRTVMVVPGLHTAGAEEPRLARLTTRLAGEGMTVLSLPLPDLRQLRVTPRSTDMIEDAALWLIAQPQVTPQGRISLFGISFGGGLSLVAAGRPSLADKVDIVVSFGGHADLPRVLRYACTGALPDGTRQPAHDYGAALLLLAAAANLVPADQAAPLERAVRAFLDASIADSTDPARGSSLFAEAQRMGDALPEPARSIMADVSARDVSRLGPRLLPLAELIGGNPALSPERAPPTRARVFLIHGSVDRVIPQTETLSLAAYLDRAPARRGNPVQSLLTPAIAHATAVRAVTAADAWAVVRFWVKIADQP